MTSEELDAPVHDIRALVSLLKQRGGAWAQVFGEGSVRITVNKQFSDLNTPLQADDEVAFISGWV